MSSYSDAFKSNQSDTVDSHQITGNGLFQRENDLVVVFILDEPIEKKYLKLNGKQWRYVECRKLWKNEGIGLICSL